jgi:hypothetical protein
VGKKLADPMRSQQKISLSCEKRAEDQLIQDKRAEDPLVLRNAGRRSANPAKSAENQLILRDAEKDQLTQW